MSKRPYFQIAHPSKHLLFPLQNYEANKQSNPDQRIRLLQESESANIRAGQIIGSLSRAVEELVRNSIHHGRAKTVTVTVGSEAYVEVKDDGIGIDADAMKKFIGTEHCSSFIEGVGNKENDPQLSGRNNLSPPGAVLVNCAARGESLKALGALCIEMRVLSTYSVGRKIDTPPSNVQFSERSKHQLKRRRLEGDNILVSCKKVIREGLAVSFQSSDNDDDSSSTIVPSRSNRAMANRSKELLPNINNSKSIIPLPILPKSKSTGTSVRLYGLFHRHAVRRRSHSAKSKNASQVASENRTRIAQVRTCIQMLAMAFPTVTMRLLSENKSAGFSIDVEWTVPKLSKIKCSPFSSIPKSNFNSVTSPSSSSVNEAQSSHFMTALTWRLHQLCGEGVLSREMFVTIEYEENDEDNRAQLKRNQALNNNDIGNNFTSPQHHHTTTTTTTTTTSCSSWGGHSKRLCCVPRCSPRKKLAREDNNWKVVGIVCLYSQDDKEKVPNNRIHQHGLIFINGIISKHNSALAAMVQGIFMNYSDLNEDNAGVKLCFILHISCPTAETSLAIDENRSFMVLRQKERLTKFIQNAICYNMRKCGFIRSKRKSTSAEGFEQKVQKKRQRSAGGNLSSGSRLVTGERIDLQFNSKKNVFKTTPNTKNQRIIPNNKITLSPFTEAFLDLTVPGCQTSLHHSPDLSFDNVFLEPSKTAVDDVTKNDKSPNPESDKEEYTTSNMTWTRSRLSSIESKISDLAVKTGTSATSKPIVLSKEMLAKAEVIAQLDSKYILISCGNLLCAVDQHAADERIGLELLEKALDIKIAGDASKVCSVDLSKLGGISSDDIIKQIPLHTVQKISLSPNQLSIIKQHRDILNKWRFQFEISGLKRDKLILKGVPGICAKVATSKDFFQFIQALGNRTSDVTLVKPAFVKRVLASHACRYAIMFGDVLTLERCKEIISSLSKCKLSFVCAHGRPSVAPLVDLNYSSEGNSNILETRRVEEGSKNTAKTNESYIPLRFQHRSLRRKNTTFIKAHDDES